MNTITSWIIEKILLLIDTIIPVIGLSPEFLSNFDNAISTFISLVEMGGYFVPLDVFTICLGSILTFNVAVLTFRFAKWAVEMVRG